MVSITEAKNFIKRHESIVNILREAGFGVSDVTQNHCWAYVVYPLRLESTIQNLITQEINTTYHTRFDTYVYAENEKELVLIARSILLSQGKNMYMDFQTNYFQQIPAERGNGVVRHSDET